MSKKLQNPRLVLPVATVVALLAVLAFMLVPGADPVVAAPCCSVCDFNVSSCLESCTPGDLDCLIGCYESQRWCYNSCNLSC